MHKILIFYFAALVSILVFFYAVLCIWDVTFQVPWDLDTMIALVAGLIIQHAATLCYAIEVLKSRAEQRRRQGARTVVRVSGASVSLVTAAQMQHQRKSAPSALYQTPTFYHWPADERTALSTFLVLAYTGYDAEPEAVREALRQAFER